MHPIDRRQFLVSATASVSLAAWPGASVADVDEFCDHVPPTLNLLRQFKLPVPLFSPDSAWKQKAIGVPLKPKADAIVAKTFEILSERKQNFCWINYDDFTVPIFAANSDGKTGKLSTHSYGCEVFEPSTLPSVKKFGRWIVKGIPLPAGVVRPSGPQRKTDQDNVIADGHLVLYDEANKFEYDFWQATTCRHYDGRSRGGGLPNTAILEAGAIEKFAVHGPGAQRLGTDCRPRNGARATGVPLLAGLLVPEDIQAGTKSVIAHALAFAIPGLRHLCPAGTKTHRDFVYPASKTEGSTPIDDPNALAAGERIRLRAVDGRGPLHDVDGNRLDEGTLAPITCIFLRALREYGAYLVDGSGAFQFFAEDIHTANFDAPPAVVNELLQRPPTTPLPADKTPWQILMEKLLDELQRLPFAVKINGTLHANFEAIADATPPDGYTHSHCTPAQINGCP